MKPNVVFFNTKNNNYLYDGNTGKIMRIDFLIKEIIEDYWDKDDDDIINIFKNKYSVSDIKHALSIIKQAEEQGLLTTFSKKIYLGGIMNELHYDLENNISCICLSVTQNCNLRCEYCAYSGIYSENRVHSDKNMPFEVAKKSIDYGISKSSAKGKFSLSFYGGEPLLRFDFIKQCIEYMLDEYHGKRILFSVITNGTLLNKEYVDYLAKHNVLIYISLDGPQEYHDEYRKFAVSHKGSFKTIEKNILDIKKRYPKYYEESVSFGVTLSPYRKIQKIEDFLSEDCIVGSNNYTRVSRVYQGNSLNIYSKKKVEENIANNIIEERFVDVRYIHSKIHQNNNYLEKSKIPLESNDFIDKFHNQRVIRCYSDKILPAGCCIPGANKLYVSVDGGFYICEKCNENFDTLKLGDIEKGIEIEKAEKIIKDFYTSTEAECLKCWAHLWCYNCPVQIEKKEELSREEKLKHCKKVKASIKKNLAYYLTILEKNPYAFDK
ncbi:radical SAM protein [Abyssisolibacter fermentans]|uniref:radical SAM protein n=1 Tax=Abyssisolibacter fermentans TaxID=1766203 RepID=UPI00082F9B68|nr:radical SAM protein [Abyssisolibacter fermentans]